MRVALVAVVVVAACANESGILVEVNSTDPTVAKVRLFVGHGDPTTHGLTIAGPHHLDGAVYYTRDANDTNDVVELTDGPRVAKFAYATSDAIPLVIAVGYDENNQPVTGGVLHDLAAPTDRNEVIAYQIELTPQVAVFGTNGEVHLGLWSTVEDEALDPYSAECAGIQIGNTEPAYFVVRENDQDCDGFETGSDNECTPNVYDGSTAANPDQPTCLIPELDPTANTSYCYLGGNSCQDGVGVDPASACAKTHVCLPATVCDACVPRYDFACAANIDSSVSTVPYYACSLPAANGQLCETTFRLARPPTGGYGCSDFQIANATSARFGTKFVSGAFEVDAIGGKDTSDSSCDARIKVPGGATAAAGLAFSGLTNFTLVNNGGVAIPIEFTLASGTGNCSDQEYGCVLHNDEAPLSSNQLQCAAGWSAPAPVSLSTSATTINGGATLTADGLEMYYVADGTLFYASRATVGGTWTSTSIGTGTLMDVRAPKLSADGSKLLFVANAGVEGNVLVEASVLGGGLGVPVIMVDEKAVTPTLRAIESASYTPDPAVLLISATTAGITMPHLFFVPRTTTMATSHLGVGTPLAISSQGAISSDRQPSLTADGLHLYYTSNRDGAPAIYVSSRARVTDDFVRAVRIAELPFVTDITGYPFVTADNTEIFYNGVSSTIGLLRATRGPL